MKIMQFALKWVHMAQHELILRLEGALWLRIISNPPCAKYDPYKSKNDPKILVGVALG